MFVDAVIHTSRSANILIVPVAAVLRDDKNEPIVYVEAAPGKFAQRSVSIGAQQNGHGGDRQRLAGGRHRGGRRQHVPAVRQQHSIRAQTE